MPVHVPSSLRPRNLRLLECGLARQARYFRSSPIRHFHGYWLVRPPKKRSESLLGVRYNYQEPCHASPSPCACNSLISLISTVMSSQRIIRPERIVQFQSKRIVQDEKVSTSGVLGFGRLLEHARRVAHIRIRRSRPRRCPTRIIPRPHTYVRAAISRPVNRCFAEYHDEARSVGTVLETTRNGTAKMC